MSDYLWRGYAFGLSMIASLAVVHTFAIGQPLVGAGSAIVIGVFLRVTKP